MQKKRIKITALVITMLMAVGVLSGCGMESVTNVNVDKKTMETTVDMYFTPEEYAELTEEATEEEISEMNMVEVEKDGKTYYKYTEKEKVKGNKLKDNGIVLDANKFIKYTNISLMDIDSEEDNPNEIYDFYSDKVTFNKSIKKTNAVLDKTQAKTIDIAATDPNKDLIYVVFTDKAKNCKTVKANITNKFTNKKTVKFTTDGVITKYTVNGKKYVPFVYTTTDSKGNSIMQRDYYEFSKNQTYTIKTTLNSGTVKTFTFVYDNVKPKVNVTNNKKYKTSKKITVTEKNLSYIKLDGKKIKNNTVVKKKGKHTVTAVDKAGNTKTVKFTIYK